MLILVVKFQDYIINLVRRDIIFAVQLLRGMYILQCGAVRVSRGTMDVLLCYLVNACFKSSLWPQQAVSACELLSLAGVPTSIFMYSSQWPAMHVICLWFRTRQSVFHGLSVKNSKAISHAFDFNVLMQPYSCMHVYEWFSWCLAIDRPVAHWYVHYTWCMYLQMLFKGYKIFCEQLNHWTINMLEFLAGIPSIFGLVEGSHNYD